jgi:hypothetical protein
MAPPPWLCPLSAGTTHHHAPLLPWTPASDVAQLPGVSLSSTGYVALRTTMATSPQRARHGRTAKVKIMRSDSPGALFPWRGVAPSVVLVGREIGRARRGDDADLWKSMGS